MKMDKKYRLTDETQEYNGNTLYRIQATKNFSNVKAGDLGGWVESEDNLSHYGSCWVYDDACVLKKAVVSECATIHDNAIISGNAKIKDSAKIFGNAKVFGNAKLCDMAKVYDKAMVYENARIFGKSEIFENAQVYGNAMTFNDSKVYGCAWVFDNAELNDEPKIFNCAKVAGNTKIYKNTIIEGNAEISGNIQIRENAVIKSKNDFLSISRLGRDRQEATFYKGSYKGKEEIYISTSYFDEEAEEMIYIHDSLEYFKQNHKMTFNKHEEYSLVFKMVEKSIVTG